MTAAGGELQQRVQTWWVRQRDAVVEVLVWLLPAPVSAVLVAVSMGHSALGTLLSMLATRQRLASAGVGDAQEAQETQVDR